MRRRSLFVVGVAMVVGSCGGGARPGAAGGSSGATGGAGGAGPGPAIGGTAGGDWDAAICSTAVDAGIDDGDAHGIDTDGDAAADSTGGVLVSCPSAPPRGCCSVESLSCAYSTESCICDGGAWKCYACPASRPNHGEGGALPPDLRLWMTCRYGDVTCSTPSTVGDILPYRGTGWSCGVCPDARPGDGIACGNTSFECRYGDETCHCGSTTGWKCVAPTCARPGRDLQGPASGCVAPGHFTCRYPGLDQVCVCGTVNDTRRCTCPAGQPVEGTPCLGRTSVSGSPSQCAYGDVQCACDGTGRWHCVAPVCPVAMPAAGSSCSMALSCAYGGSFCACDGASWSCS